MIFEMYANDHDGIQSRVPIIAELSPKDMIPKYCHHYFPDEDKIIDFINPWHDENMYEAIAKYATWYPLDKLQRM